LLELHQAHVQVDLAQATIHLLLPLDLLARATIHFHPAALEDLVLVAE